ncbi:MAG: class I SAM-dependent methyltransferase [Flavobacteriales bacterium]|nr:class I SAM-dependent methyltransferase [Flavobacteriales bacterium]
MSKKNDLLVDQSYWDASYSGMRPAIAPPEDALRQWLEARVPKAKSEQHALEVGCFPGRYLAVLGQLGYTVHGVDLTPGVENMAEALKATGLSTGEFRRTDFLKMEVDRQYDLVSSFGFIEHFTDWRSVLLKHAELVSPGGMLVIETPNFKGGVQQLFHRWLDSTNLRRHNLDAMEPHAWAELLREQGFIVQWAGWFGQFDFWSDPEPDSLGHRIGAKLLGILKPRLAHMKEGSPSLSPYCGLIATKA